MESIYTDDAPAYGDAPLSQGTIQDGLVYASGQLGVDPETADAVELRIMNGQVCIRPVSQDRDQSDPISLDAN